MIALPLLAQGDLAAGLGADFYIVLAFAAVCLPVFARMASALARGEGRVNSRAYGMPDLLFVLVLAGWAGLTAITVLRNGGENQPMTLQGIYESALMFAIVVGCIGLFLWYRNLSIARLFGLERPDWLQLLGKSVLWLLAAYPLILLTMQTTQLVLGGEAAPQKIVEFFSEALQEGRSAEVIATVLTAGLIAPVVEEFIFRGYFYGTFRRYLGPWGAMVVTSLLFAVIHLNLLALPSLFVLAICFTLAYEATGSLWVPIVMHAIFNATNLTFVLFSAGTP